jgi:hypothetical protein
MHIYELRATPKEYAKFFQKLIMESILKLIRGGIKCLLQQFLQNKN